MSQSTKTYRNYRTRISRADLLDCIASSPENWQEQAKQLGFEKIDKAPRKDKKQSQQQEQSNEATTRQANADDTRKQQRPAAQFHYVASYSGRSNQQLETEGELIVQAPEWYDPNNSYNPNKIQSDPTVSAPKHKPIISNARLFRYLQKQLNTKKHTPSIDVDKLMDNLSRGKWFAEIPHKQRKAWASKLIIVIEKNRSLWPFDADIKQLIKDLVDLRGRDNIDLRVVENNYKKHHYTRLNDKSYTQIPWNFSNTQTPVLIISDIANLQYGNWHYWKSWGKRFKQAAIKPSVLMPCAMLSTHRSFTSYLSLLYWSQKINNLAVHQAEQTNKSIEELLVLLAPASRIEPALLRELCRTQLINNTPTTDVEARIGQHKAIKSYPSAFVFRAGEQKSYREKFKQLPHEKQQKIKQLLAKHHSHLHPAVLHEENAVWHSLVSEVSDAETKKTSQGFLQQTVSTLKSSSNANVILEWSEGLLGRMDETTFSQNNELKTIWGVLYEKDLKKNKQLELPAGIHYDDIKWLVDKAQTMQDYVLYQRQQHLCIATKKHFSDLSHTSLVLQFSSRMKTAQINPSNRLLQLPADGQENHIPYSLSKQTFTLSSDQQSWTIQMHTRPSWASNAGHDQWGYFAEFTINKVVQRLRWIPAGHFLMGSPETEAERYDNETQHAVTLTTGYWLADAACTQALWQTVMGENPARFKENIENPVEQVSWKDTQAFIKKLQQKIPELELSLPTEAQWEYACRAATTTPFNLGENITPDQVNYDGGNPYNGGKKGKYRGKTVPVKSMQTPNAWGLHEMHGNVWEWCQDWRGDYPDSSVENPEGAKTGSERVLRGGSWFSSGGRVRSAQRDADRPAGRDGNIGFRLSGQSNVQVTAEQKENKRNDVGQAEGRRQSGIMERMKEWVKK